MQANRRKKKSAHASLTGSASGAAIQSTGGCKILPFRPACARASVGANEPDYRRMAVQQADDWSLEERNECPVVYLPEYSERAPSSGCPSFLASRRLKIVMLMGSFVAWTAAAIALSIALG